jgi:hypothetical protein
MACARSAGKNITRVTENPPERGVSHAVSPIPWVMVSAFGDVSSATARRFAGVFEGPVPRARRRVCDRK